MNNLPNKIYLQIGYAPEEADDFTELDEVTWSVDNIHGNDIEYHLSSKVDSEMIAFAGWCSKYYSTDDSKTWHPACDISEDYNLEFTTAQLLEKFREEHKNIS